MSFAPPPRGFEDSEFRARVERAQARMAKAGIDALLLSTEPDVRYFTGFLTRFWESPARPWFVIVPASGDPVAVIPSIGVPLMGSTWIKDIRSWRSPDLADDGVELLCETLREIAGPDARIGLPSDLESHVRMPLNSLNTLRTRMDLRDDANIVRDLRCVKSAAEIAKITQACGIGSRAFARVGEIATAGTPLDEIYRRFQMLLLEEGADFVTYLAGGAGQDGYGDVISPATATPLVQGDILMLDTGAVWDGYYCDFDRNFAVGGASDLATATHRQLIDATQAGFEAAKPGASMADLYHAMMGVLASGSEAGADAGRIGHGLGMQLTEWPSMIPAEQTLLQEGMVLTLEPSTETRDGRILVHEENIAITATGAVYLNTPAGRDLEVI